MVEGGNEARDLAGGGADIETVIQLDARFARREIVPVFLNGKAQGGDGSDAGDDDAFVR